MEEQSTNNKPHPESQKTTDPETLMQKLEMGGRSVEVINKLRQILSNSPVLLEKYRLRISSVYEKFLQEKSGERTPDTSEKLIDHLRNILNIPKEETTDHFVREHKLTEEDVIAESQSPTSVKLKTILDSLPADDPLIKEKKTILLSLISSQQNVSNAQVESPSSLRLYRAGATFGRRITSDVEVQPAAPLYIERLFKMKDSEHTLSMLCYLLEKGWKLGKSQQNALVGRIGKPLDLSVQAAFDLEKDSNTQTKDILYLLKSLYSREERFFSIENSEQLVSLVETESVKKLEFLFRLIEDLPKEQQHDAALSVITFDGKKGIAINFDALSRIIESKQKAESPDNRKIKTVWEALKSRGLLSSDHTEFTNFFCAHSDEFLSIDAEEPHLSLQLYVTCAQDLRSKIIEIDTKVQQPNYVVDELEKRLLIQEKQRILIDFDETVLNSQTLPKELLDLGLLFQLNRGLTIFTLDDIGYENIAEYFQGGKMLSSFLLKTIQHEINNGSNAFITDELMQNFSEQEKQFWNTWKNLKDVSRQVLKEKLKDAESISASELQQISVIIKVEQLLSIAPYEIQKFETELLIFSLSAEDPLSKLQNIIEILTSQLPDIVKIYKFFELSYLNKQKPEFSALHRRLEQEDGANMSPTLKGATKRRRNQIIYNDLIKMHIDGGNTSLFEYSTVLLQVDSIYKKIQANETISTEENRIATQFLEDASILLQNTIESVLPENSLPSHLKDRFNRLLKILNPKPDQNISDRFSEMYFGTIGIHSVAQLRERMQSKKKTASERNKTGYNEDKSKNQTFQISEGDLLKGINFDYLPSFFESQVPAPQYIGFAQKDVLGDRTPFDTDTSRVPQKRASEGIRSSIEHSMAIDYSGGSGIEKGKGLLLIVKNRGQFIDTTENPESSYDEEKIEIFWSGSNDKEESEGEKLHFGIRTGIELPEVEAFVALDDVRNSPARMEELKLQMAVHNTFYRIVDIDGNDLFTPEEFESYSFKKESINQILSHDVTPETVINAIKDSSKGFELLFGKDLVLAGKEDLTLEQHTLNVMRVYEKNKKDFGPLILDDTEFLILFGFHDIGKPLGYDLKNSNAFQHEYTTELVRPALAQLDISPNRSALIIDVINQDFIGEYFQRQEILDESAQKIAELAKKHNISTDELINVLKMYYTCDAGSYTKGISGNESAIDKFFDQEAREFSEEGKQLFDRLHQKANYYSQSPESMQESAKQA